MSTKAGFDNGIRVAATDPEEVFALVDASGQALHESALDECPGISDAQLEYVNRVVERRLFEAQAKVLRKLLFLLLDAKKPKRRIYQLLYASGMGAACGGSASSIAKRLGISKQAFEQSAQRDLASLDMRKNALEKKEGAAAKYAETNYRRIGAAGKEKNGS